MFRITTLFILVVGLSGLSAFVTTVPGLDDDYFIYNTTVANYFRAETRTAPSFFEAGEEDGMWGDSSIVNSESRVLMLNYSAYDSAYANKIHRLIERRMPDMLCTDFWDGTAEDLNSMLPAYDVVIVTYPSAGRPELLAAYGKVLAQYVKQGGNVIFTGTHIFSVVQQYNLLDVEYGYYADDLSIHELQTDHPIFVNTLSDFSVSDYVYPLKISDPAFVTLAEVGGYPVIGYKSIGSGKVVYLGLEYYYEDLPEYATLTGNTLRWLLSGKKTHTTTTSGDNWTASGAKRRVEVLRAGSGANAPSYEVRIYPNPYYAKATLDLDLPKQAVVSIDITDETGRKVHNFVTTKQLGNGLYHFDLPNLPPGVYFVQMRIGESTTVRKVVKSAAP